MHRELLSESDNMAITYEEIIDELKACVKDGLAEFSAKLTPNCGLILGVSVKDIRRIAKRLKSDYEAVLNLPHNNILEINLLKGCALGYADCDIDTKCRYLHTLAKEFKNWQETDITACSIKVKLEEKPRLWETALLLTCKNGEFEIRQGIVLILASLVDSFYINKIFEVLNRVTYGAYYVDMAAAWLLSVCYVKFPNLTSDYLFGENKLNAFTYSKALQKIIESYRVNDEDKAFIRSKRKNKS
ncbi:MAG: DNA alkylation repair protein [Clostridia bacterium]|nr:DNA alkylation repair protein [Clostridia bacterium]